VSEGEKTRLIAWSHEMRAVHTRLREALRVARDAVRESRPAKGATRDLLLFCHGFCAALTGHHEGEDGTLFPAIAAAYPDLRGTLAQLEQDHSMISHLLAELQDAVDEGAPPEELDLHLEGVSALMENHFRYEERRLLTVLETLELDRDPAEALGPL